MTRLYLNVSQSGVRVLQLRVALVHNLVPEGIPSIKVSELLLLLSRARNLRLQTSVGILHHPHSVRSLPVSVRAEYRLSLLQLQVLLHQQQVILTLLSRHLLHDLLQSSLMTRTRLKSLRHPADSLARSGSYAANDAALSKATAYVAHTRHHTLHSIHRLCHAIVTRRLKHLAQPSRQVAHHLSRSRSRLTKALQLSLKALLLTILAVLEQLPNRISQSPERILTEHLLLQLLILLRQSLQLLRALLQSLQLSRRKTKPRHVLLRDSPLRPSVPVLYHSRALSVLRPTQIVHQHLYTVYYLLHLSHTLLRSVCKQVHKHLVLLAKLRQLSLVHRLQRSTLLLRQLCQRTLLHILAYRTPVCVHCLLYLCTILSKLLADALALLLVVLVLGEQILIELCFGILLVCVCGFSILFQIVFLVSTQIIHSNSWTLQPLLLPVRMSLFK